MPEPIIDPARIRRLERWFRVKWYLMPWRRMRSAGEFEEAWREMKANHGRAAE